MPYTVALPIGDRQRSYAFYRDALGLEPVGEPGDDGVPEPLAFTLGPGVVLMLVPTGGFGWVVADHAVAERGRSECLLGMAVPTEADVDAATERVRTAGGEIKVEPADPGWGYSSTFADPDGHLWMIELAAGPLAP